MAEYALSVFLVVSRDRICRGIVKHGGDYLRKYLRLKRTASVSYHSVSPGGKKAGYQPVFRFSDRILCLVSVSLRLARRKHIPDLNIRKPRLDKGVFNIRALEVKLVFIGYMPIDTTSAAFGRATRVIFQANRRRLGNRDKPSDAVARIDLDYLSLDSISGDSSGDENHSAVREPSDTATEVIEIGNLYPYLIIFIHA